MPKRQAKPKLKPTGKTTTIDLKGDPSSPKIDAMTTVHIGSEKPAAVIMSPDTFNRLINGQRAGKPLLGDEIQKNRSIALDQRSWDKLSAYAKSKRRSVSAIVREFVDTLPNPE